MFVLKSSKIRRIESSAFDSWPGRFENYLPLIKAPSMRLSSRLEELLSGLAVNGRCKISRPNVTSIDKEQYFVYYSVLFPSERTFVRCFNAFHRCCTFALFCRFFSSKSSRSPILSLQMCSHYSLIPFTWNRQSNAFHLSLRLFSEES